MNHNGQEHDEQEEPVVEEARENVIVAVSQLAGINLVENLHEDEGLEADSVELSLQTHCVLRARRLYSVERSVLLAIALGVDKRGVSIVIEAKPVFAACKNKEHNDNLVESLAEDVPPHDFVHNLVGFGFRFAVEKILAGRLSSEGESCKGIHNQVDPKHLN